MTTTTRSDFEVWLSAQVDRDDETGAVARAWARDALDLSYLPSRQALRAARAEYDVEQHSGRGVIVGTGAL